MIVYVVIAVAVAYLMYRGHREWCIAEAQSSAVSSCTRAPTTTTSAPPSQRAEAFTAATTAAPNIVLYHTTWCPASTAFYPTWVKFEKRVRSMGLPIHVNDMICDGGDKASDPSSNVVEPQTCKATFGVNEYPTIILYHQNREHRFTGDRTTINLVKFVKRICEF